jgi:hypothetical protein
MESLEARRVREAERRVEVEKGELKWKVEVEEKNPGNCGRATVGNRSPLQLKLKTSTARAQRGPT